MTVIVGKQLDIFQLMVNEGVKGRGQSYQTDIGHRLNRKKLINKLSDVITHNHAPSLVLLWPLVHVRWC